VEIGGVVEKFCAQNPPPNLLEKELKFKMPWYLYLAELAPEVRIKNATVTPLDGRAVSVKATIENRGFLPTNVTEWAVKAGLAKPILVTIVPQECVLLDGKAEVRLGHIPGRSTVSEEGLFSETSRTVSWVLKKTGGKASLKVVVISEKGGRDEKLLDLK